MISNWDSSLVPIIEGLELGRYFDCVITSGDVGLHKPDAAIFLPELR